VAPGHVLLAPDKFKGSLTVMRRAAVRADDVGLVDISDVASWRAYRGRS
jgi:hypothetical protein